jgi:methylenetetrahydrofolate dehydrogenase (NADP+)/methenyltetrahydrofolate cyclohydrolase
MSAKIIDGKAVAARIKDELKKEIIALKENGISPGLAVVIVGNNPASRSYVNNKKRDCEEIGINSFEYALPEDTTEDKLIELINALNQDKKVDGILVQLPLPKHLNEDTVINSIDPKKDADCFHPFNVGNLMIGKPGFQPCTPAGVMELIKESGIEVTGKECVVLGRSNIVGKPQAIMLLCANGTVTVCHSKTKNLDEVCKRADILVVAIGKAKFLKANAVKPGAIVIDVGINRDENGKMVGDVDFESVKEVAGAITPVPGGVGPMTRAILLKNTLHAVKNR